MFKNSRLFESGKKADQCRSDTVDAISHNNRIAAVNGAVAGAIRGGTGGPHSMALGAAVGAVAGVTASTVTSTYDKVVKNPPKSCQVSDVMRDESDNPLSYNYNPS